MINFSWDDVTELYDDENLRKSLRLESAIENNTNFLIKGDNYPVLLCLKNQLQQKIDIIYIDPPYNTGNDFTYNDDFGTSGDRHSEWLSFMKRRLEVSKDLLAESGCIFIAIDQSELYVLKLLCDQIFGEDNFVNDFMWLHGKGKKDKWSRTLQQHTLCYAKNKRKLAEFTEIEYSSWANKNVDNDPRGDWFSGSISFNENRSNPNHHNYFSISSPSGKIWTRQWQVSKQEMVNLIRENKIYWGQAPAFDKVPRLKIFNDSETEVIPRNIIDSVESTRSAQNHLDELLGIKNVFDNPKPVDLISHLIEITRMKKDALILDFFAGSGTTFEAVCELNSRDGGERHCILVQKPEEIKKPSSEFVENGLNSIFDICNTRCQKVCKIYNAELKVTELTSLVK